MGEATAYYEPREAELGAETMREVERQVMLRIIDQKWREHLYEMDYLQEGINLRAMGQKDPLVEWQREGFEMFGAMMQGVAQDFVKYVMHAQVTVAQPKLDTPDPDRQRPVHRAGRPVRGAEHHGRRRPGPGRGRGARGPARGGRGGHPGPGREVRVGQDPAQRPLPLRHRQEVQALPRPVGLAPTR